MPINPMPKLKPAEQAQRRLAPWTPHLAALIGMAAGASQLLVLPLEKLLA